MRIPALMPATVILLAGSLAAQSTPASISQFPPVDRVKVEVQGADPMDTAARHMGAFWQLQQIIKQMTGLRWTNNRLTPEEKRLIGDYSAAYQAAAQPYASYPDRPKWYKMHAFYETSHEFREELFRRFLSAGVRGQWAQTEAQTKATVEAGQRAREQAVREEREQAEAAHKEFRAQLGIREPTESQRLAARCIAAGRSESDCMIEAAARDFQKMVPISKNKARTPGLIITGVYAAPGGFSATFGATGRGWVTCKGISAEATYKVERVGNQLQLKLLDYTSADLLGYGSEALSKLAPAEQMNPTEWQRQRVAFPVLADGKLSASGAIRVTGQFAVGTRSGTKEVTETQHGTRTRTLTPVEADAARRGGANPVKNGMTYTITEPTTTETTSTVPTSETIYETRTVTCPLAPMVPTGKATATAMGTSVAEGAGSAVQMMFDVLGNNNPIESAAKRIPDPGLRMDGQYAGQDGFDVEFYPTSAVIGCRDAAVSRDYTVSASAGLVLVNIQNGATQLVLELRPDGTLSGSGTARVDGRIVRGQDASGNIAFRPVTDTCRIGMLTPK